MLTFDLDTDETIRRLPGFAGARLLEAGMDRGVPA